MKQNSESQQPTIHEVWDLILSHYTYGGKKNRKMWLMLKRKSSQWRPTLDDADVEISDKDFKAAYLHAQGQRGKYVCNEWKEISAGDV